MLSATCSSTPDQRLARHARVLRTTLASDEDSIGSDRRRYGENLTTHGDKRCRGCTLILWRHRHLPRFRAMWPRRASRPFALAFTLGRKIVRDCVPGIGFRVFGGLVLVYIVVDCGCFVPQSQVHALDCTERVGVTDLKTGLLLGEAELRCQRNGLRARIRLLYAYTAYGVFCFVSLADLLFASGE